jgi:hypothetical protein
LEIVEKSVAALRMVVAETADAKKQPAARKRQTPMDFKVFPP